MALPCALVLSCSDLQPKTLVKNIIGCDELPASTPVLDAIKSYPWHIETKYYTADISLCTAEEKSIENLEFANSVHAVIVHFDAQNENSFGKVKEWIPFIKEYSAEVQLLLCDSCNDKTKLTRSEIQAWCLEHEFELVELQPEEEDSDNDDDFQETTSIKRVTQALHAHLWPNMKLKEQTKCAGKVPEVKNTDDSESELLAGISDFILEEKNALEILGPEDLEGQTFESLFLHFAQMKDKAKNLPPEERKRFAEKVAIAFWKTMGGDEEEIEGLEDEDEDEI